MEIAIFLFGKFYLTFRELIWTQVGGLARMPQFFYRLSTHPLLVASGGFYKMHKITGSLPVFPGKPNFDVISIDYVISCIISLIAILLLP